MSFLLQHRRVALPGLPTVYPHKRFQKFQEAMGAFQKHPSRRDLWPNAWKAAAALGNVEALRSLSKMNTGTNVRRSFQDIASALVLAANYGQLSAVSYLMGLLAQQPDNVVTNLQMRRPLAVAAKRGHAPVLLYLLGQVSVAGNFATNLLRAYYLSSVLYIDMKVVAALEDKGAVNNLKAFVPQSAYWRDPQPYFGARRSHVSTIEAARSPNQARSLRQHFESMPGLCLDI